CQTEWCAFRGERVLAGGEAGWAAGFHCAVGWRFHCAVGWRFEWAVGWRFEWAVGWRFERHGHCGAGCGFHGTGLRAPAGLEDLGVVGSNHCRGAGAGFCRGGGFGRGVCFTGCVGLGYCLGVEGQVGLRCRLSLRR
ncbi:hypothetical protein, partial [Actinoplanes sp. TFC3]|uniref:hypothetical protein n=1 Tax=Actinoplanes sp. TFC3 TaxID=1710355 RepID=UPI00083075EC